MDAPEIPQPGLTELAHELPAPQFVSMGRAFHSFEKKLEENMRLLALFMFFEINLIEINCKT